MLSNLTLPFKTPERELLKCAPEHVTCVTCMEDSKPRSESFAVANPQRLTFEITFFIKPLFSQGRNGVEPDMSIF